MKCSSPTVCYRTAARGFKCKEGKIRVVFSTNTINYNRLQLVSVVFKHTISALINLCIQMLNKHAMVFLFSFGFQQLSSSFWTCLNFTAPKQISVSWFICRPDGVKPGWCLVFTTPCSLCLLVHVNRGFVSEQYVTLWESSVGLQLRSHRCHFPFSPFEWKHLVYS